jgi:drug/metabolite transporter (DMT)-like permease
VNVIFYNMVMKNIVSTSAVFLPSRKLSTLVLACLLATWVVWGSTYLAIKVALISLPPFIQMGSRFIVAGALLLAWMKWRGAKMPTFIEWRNALVVGTLMLGIGMGGVAYSEQTVASGLVVSFIAVQPMWQALLQSLWKVYPTKVEMLGIIVGAIGVSMLVQGQGFGASTQGLIAITLAILCWGLGSVLSQRVTPLAKGATGFASEMLMGGVVLLGISAIAGETIKTPLDSKAVIAWVYLVVFGSLVAFNAYMVLLEKASPALATSYSFVNPIIALALGIWFADEVITKWEWFSAIVIVSGVILIVLAAIKKPDVSSS